MGSARNGMCWDIKAVVMTGKDNGCLFCAVSWPGNFYEWPFSVLKLVLINVFRDKEVGFSPGSSRKEKKTGENIYSLLYRVLGRGCLQTPEETLMYCLKKKTCYVDDLGKQFLKQKRLGNLSSHHRFICTSFPKAHQVLHIGSNHILQL